MMKRMTVVGLLVALAGCGGGSGSSGSIKLGAMPAEPSAAQNGAGGTGTGTGSGTGTTPAAGSGSGTSAPAGTPSATSATVTVDGVAVVPPAWFAAGDETNLAVGVDSYIRDAQAALTNWLPQPASASQLPLTVIFHDVAGANFWDASTRTAWLEWPKAASGKPVRTSFAPLLAQVLVLDRKRELGTGSAPWTAEENDAATRGRNLAVTLTTFFPANFDN